MIVFSCTGVRDPGKEAPQGLRDLTATLGGLVAGRSLRDLPVINLGAECLAVTTEVRSAGRCRLTKVRSAWRCMPTDLFHLSHLPPDGCTTSAVAGIGSHFRIIELFVVHSATVLYSASGCSTRVSHVARSREVRAKTSG